MADNRRSEESLSSSVPSHESAVSERREFFKRAALIGLPVVLASVHARTAWANQVNGPSCGNSLGPSGCANRNGITGVLKH